MQTAGQKYFMFPQMDGLVETTFLTILYADALMNRRTKDPFVHIHPHAIETYEVLEGEMEFFINDRWKHEQCAEESHFLNGSSRLVSDLGNVSHLLPAYAMR